jgi:hypothetical protein
MQLLSLVIGALSMSRFVVADVIIYCYPNTAYTGVSRFSRFSSRSNTYSKTIVILLISPTVRLGVVNSL